jgi:hypothetical protein
VFAQQHPHDDLVDLVIRPDDRHGAHDVPGLISLRPHLVRVLDTDPGGG